jgi:hypothetical protein
VGKPVEVLDDGAVLERSAVPFAHGGPLRLDRLLVTDSEGCGGPGHARRRLVPDGSTDFGKSEAEIHRRRGKRRERLVEPPDAQECFAPEHQESR